MENLQFCNQEISQLLLYLIKQLNERRIGCVVEYKMGEYTFQPSNALLSELEHLENYFAVGIDILNETQAVDYLKSVRPDLPYSTAQAIVSLVGCRLYNLALTMDYLKRRVVDFGNPRQVAVEIAALTPNDIPNIVNKFFPFYREKNQTLFDLIGLLHGSVPCEFLPIIEIDYSEIDKLIDEQMLVCKSEHILPANEFVRREILDGVSPLHVRQVLLANKLISFIERNQKKYQAEAIYLLYHTQQYDKALWLLDCYIGDLKRERQYSALIEYLDIAIDIAKKQSDYNKYADYLVKQLDIIVLKKEIIAQKAEGRISELSELLCTYKVTIGYETMQMAHDYFLGKRIFKLGRLREDEPIFKVNREHYEDCVNDTYRDNTGDWLGRVCCIYAFFVKDTMGNKLAADIFQLALSAMPDSFELRREYYSHIACMQLYDLPKDAYQNYQKILDMFQEQAENYAFPFHEYGDLAMSLLLSGNPEQAIRQAEEGITLAESHGVLDEVGRITNIEGCAWLCTGNIEKAEERFSESTALMERSGYKLYCWRSRLNELQMRLQKGADQITLRTFLQETYLDFKTLLQCKIQKLAHGSAAELFKTREYHALLIFAKCFRLLSIPQEAKIVEEFGLENIAQAYMAHVNNWLENPETVVVEGSPYFTHGKIFMIG